MAKSKVSKEEIKTIEGIIGAKVGLGLGAQLDLLKSKYLAVPIILGSAGATMLSNKETDKKVSDAIKFVKESSMDKATIVFNKMASAAGLGIMLGIGFAPKPRKTVTGISSASGKDLKMKKMVNTPLKK